jgi:hypothetical protein
MKTGNRCNVVNQVAETGEIGDCGNGVSDRTPVGGGSSRRRLRTRHQGEGTSTHHDENDDDNNNHQHRSHNRPRGRQKYRRQGREESRSPSQPPGTCPVGCATMYYLLWVLFGCILFDNTEHFPFTTLIGREEGSVILKDSRSTAHIYHQNLLNSRLKIPTSSKNDAEIFDKSVKQDRSSQQQRLQFVFIASLPGTGHGTISRLVEESPIITPILQEMKIMTNAANHVKTLQNLLWPYGSSSNTTTAAIGLWNAHCITESSMAREVNLTAMMEDVVHEFQTIQQLHDGFMNHQVQHEDTITTVTRIPINVLMPRMDKNNHQHRDSIDEDYPYGVSPYMTFPNGYITNDPPSSALSSCRPLDYPNLDLLFHACDVAGVYCRLVYLHHSPTSLLQQQQQEQSKSSSPTTILPTMHLLTSMLSIITTDLYLYYNRVLGCIEMDQQDIQKRKASPKVSGNGSESSTSWKDMVFRLFWMNAASEKVGASFERNKDDMRKERKNAFESALASISHDETVHAKSKRQLVIPQEFDPYMKAYILASDRVSDVCREIMG